MVTSFTTRYIDHISCLCVEGDSATECPCFLDRKCSCARDYDHEGTSLKSGEFMWHCGCRICPNLTPNGMYVNPHNKTGAFSGQSAGQQYPLDWDGVHTVDLPCPCGETMDHLCTTCTNCACKL